MTSETIELVEQVRRRLSAADASCDIRGPVPQAAIDAAEEALGCTFPPSYRTFLLTFGGISLPPHLGIVHDFIGVTETRGGDEPSDVVARTLQAREERRLSGNLIVVGLGANQQEWFCLDVNRTNPHGECPVVLFDARENARDQQFYDDFGQMFSEVIGFVAETLEQPLD
ncbi:MAG: SMI1/KNR4 family protein [Kofleriaceae bacterium]